MASRPWSRLGRAAVMPMKPVLPVAPSGFKLGGTKSRFVAQSFEKATSPAAAAAGGAAVAGGESAGRGAARREVRGVEDSNAVVGGTASNRASGSGGRSLDLALALNSRRWVTEDAAVTNGLIALASFALSFLMLSFALGPLAIARWGVLCSKGRCRALASSEISALDTGVLDVET